MTLAAAPARVVHATMARQPNHHHHHHHVSSTSSSSATPARLFDLPNAYVGYGSGATVHGASSSYGSYLLPFASSSSQHVRPTTTTTHLLPLPPAAITPLRLTGREDSTRVRLQRQRVGEQYRRAIVGDRIPGFKTSAGECSFLSFLPFLLLATAMSIDSCFDRPIDDVSIKPWIKRQCSRSKLQSARHSYQQSTTILSSHNQANHPPFHPQPFSPPFEPTSASPPLRPRAQCPPHPACAAQQPPSHPPHPYPSHPNFQKPNNLQHPKTL